MSVPLPGLLLSLWCLIMVVAVGCSDSSTSPSGQGQIRLFLVDAPADYDQVNIVVTQVVVHAAGSESESGWLTVSDTTATYDLLLLTNGANSILGDHMLPVGKYTQIRLGIGPGSNVVIGGIPYPLNVSSATGLKLNHNFEIEEGKLYLLTLDFDAARSIRLNNDGSYRLQPVIRVVANVVSGTISGTIDPTSIRTTVMTTVAAGDTVSTESDTTDGSFSLVALPAGIYDLTFTPTDTGYLSTSLLGVQVMAEQDKDIGTVTLTAKP